MQTAFTEYFESLRGKRIAVLGLGVSNRPLVRLLLKFGCDVTGCDRTPREKLDEEVLELEKDGCRLSLGDGYLDGIEADVVFRTPGMHPGNPAIEGLRAKGAKITSEMEVFFELCRCHTIAVTGSDGKTTTTTLVSELLKAEGKRVWLGGNIGTPLLSFLPEMQEEDFAVVELSSFQLMDMERSAQRAVITNLSPNHLDVHKDMDEYIEAKKNVYKFQNETGLLVVNADNAITAPLTGNGETRYFSRQIRPENGTYLENGIIYRVKNGVSEEVMPMDTILLPGIHNVENYMTAIAVTDGLVSDDTVRHVAATFGGVEHRIELVRVKDGVRYYNDSIASSPSRTIAGLRSFEEKVILIAGGYDKHIPFDVLGPEVCAHVKRLYLTGATARKIYDAVVGCPDYAEGSPEILVMDDFTETVHAAAASAKEGDVVLLSPACAAFDKFKNFMVRGKFFKKLVQEL
ncbi:MAG: UDP-N-acetylmuramoyl-L-alanine--D-glutamate ligase [Oscillospiraceae bacterium]|nr:UDP-N-acetylmuramoyl-L-alanine--D-glutamate ligase [Oscillospiraceae bacterium]